MGEDQTEGQIGHEASHSLSPGTYKYYFIVDGRRRYGSKPGGLHQTNHQYFILLTTRPPALYDVGVSVLQQREKTLITCQLKCRKRGQLTASGARWLPLYAIFRLRRAGFRPFLIKSTARVWTKVLVSPVIPSCEATCCCKVRRIGLTQEKTHSNVWGFGSMDKWGHIMSISIYTYAYLPVQWFHSLALERIPRI